MTVIQPNKDKGVIGLIIFLSGLLTVVSALTIIVYSKTVSLRQDIAGLTQSIQTEQVQNAELKDKFFALTDPSSLQQLAAKDGFVRVVNPQWAFVSRS
ncbi:MAG: hypothetical protein M1312_01485 [Patescibacteria group bacterium]|nr:hypothetical protein [Patescibacteria group bacterium]MDE2144939.1 hypothetical protein [Patescibacteria group bacterium]